MVQTIQASDLTLYEVEEKFNLRQIEEPQFFLEWQGDLPELSDYEKQCLNDSRLNFLSLSKYPLHEEIVKLTILAPLLSLAGLLRYPFYPQAEAEIKVAVEDDGEVVRGRIDVRILLKRLWAIVIESKNKQFSIDVALPQALVYMMANPNQDRSTFGFVTNGKHFQFIKLVEQDQPKYALSDEFSIANQRNEIDRVLQILKRLKNFVQEGWRDLLVQLVQKRRIVKRRQEIAQNATQTFAAMEVGTAKCGSISDLMQDALDYLP